MNVIPTQWSIQAASVSGMFEPVTVKVVNAPKSAVSGATPVIKIGSVVVVVDIVDTVVVVVAITVLVVVGVVVVVVVVMCVVVVVVLVVVVLVVVVVVVAQSPSSMGTS